MRYKKNSTAFLYSRSLMNIFNQKQIYTLFFKITFSSSITVEMKQTSIFPGWGFSLRRCYCTTVLKCKEKSIVIKWYNSYFPLIRKFLTPVCFNMAPLLYLIFNLFRRQELQIVRRNRHLRIRLVFVQTALLLIPGFIPLSKHWTSPGHKELWMYSCEIIAIQWLNVTVIEKNWAELQL